jgi:ferritin-like metal-binding protein YciE
VAIETMQDLLVHEMRDLLNAERQLVKALPKMANAAVNPELSEAFQDHLAETENQIARLEECLTMMGQPTRGKKCAGMEGLIEEAEDMVEECEDDAVLDAAIIGAAQRVEHYEIAAYGTARAFAVQLGLDEVADLLSTTLDEESAANEKLTAIAEAGVNAEAGAGELDEEEMEGSNGNGNGRRKAAGANSQSRSKSRKSSSSKRSESSASTRH